MVLSFLYLSGKISLLQQTCVLNKQLYPATLFRKETLKHVFPGEFCPIYKNAFFLEHLWTAASETGTENGVGNLAQSKEFSARR